MSYWNLDVIAGSPKEAYFLFPEYGSDWEGYDGIVILISCLLFIVVCL